MAELSARLAQAGVVWPEGAEFGQAGPSAAPPAPPPPVGRGLKALSGLLVVGTGTVIGLFLYFSRPASSSLPAKLEQAPAPAHIAFAARVSEANGSADPGTASPSIVSRRAPAAHADPAQVAAPVTATATATPSAMGAKAPRASGSKASLNSASEPAVFGPEQGRVVVESELDLLKQARNTLNADPARAYALTERYRAQYPRGAFAQERDFMAITALSRLGRTSDARSSAADFRARYPRSAYLAQIDRMLGER
jgi:hypothetical protein